MDKSYRERAEEFAGKYVTRQQKKICIEVLCFVHGQRKCPKVREIQSAVLSKVDIRTTCPSFAIYLALEEMIRKFYGNEKYFASNWPELKNIVFKLSKTL